MASWYDAWADRYDERPTEVTADVSFYVGLAREAGGPLVELAVGTGRVAIPVAQATGRRVLGIDSSPGMLAQARRRAVEEGVEPTALIYCPGRSLLHLPTWGDRRALCERVAASLRPNGRFAWNAFALDHHIAAALDGQHADGTPGLPVPHTIHYSVADNRADITLDDGGTGSLWWATKNEWLGLLDVAGLQLEALYGGFAGEPLDDDSREYVFVARR
jgi:SAM-dependent methyltransferase